MLIGSRKFSSEKKAQSFLALESNSKDNSLETFLFTLNENGVTILCLELLALGVDKNVRFQAMAVLNGLLDQAGGSSVVQETVNTYLTETDSVQFFEMIFDMLHFVKVLTLDDFFRIKNRNKILPPFFLT